MHTMSSEDDDEYTYIDDDNEDEYTYTDNDNEDGSTYDGQNAVITPRRSATSLHVESTTSLTSIPPLAHTTVFNEEVMTTIDATTRTNVLLLNASSQNNNTADWILTPLDVQARIDKKVNVEAEEEEA